jgi:hypothetical protein
MILTLSLLVALACAKMERASEPAPVQAVSDASGPQSLASRAEAAEPPAASPAGAPRYVAKTGSMEIIVADAAAATAAVSDLVSRHGAFIAGRESQAVIPQREVLSPSEVRTLRLTIKIPAERFDAFIEDVKQIGSYTQEVTGIEDVTFQYVDLEARLSNSRQVEKRLLDHLKAAAEIKDIVEVERELSRVREQIESQTAQFKVLADKVAFSTLTLSVSVRPDWTPPAQRTFWEDISQTFAGSLAGLANAGRLTVIYGLALLPWALFFGLVLWGVVRLLRLVRRWLGPKQK